jgi:beta-lactamase class A
MLCFMNLLARDRLLGPSQNVEMRLDLFQQQKADRIPAKLPADTRVAHKTGEIEGVRNDVGIVYTTEATWVIAVFSRDADEGEATATIARLSKRLYDYIVAPLSRS